MNIIIVKYKNPEAEKRCIESVEKFTDLSKHTLTVFDNEAAGNINLGKLWNQLIEESRDEIICLLNSDCVVEEGWDRIDDIFTKEWYGKKERRNLTEKEVNVGSVGPITDNCGTAQKELKREDSIQEINDLSGFCYVFRKSVWKEVGGFPEDMPFYGQESIFNRELQDRGYKLMVDRRVFVSHEKGSSFKKAVDRGEPIRDEAEWGALHYWNYIDRLKLLRKAVDKDFRIIIIGGGRDNPFPLHQGLEQACDEFFGANALLIRDVQCFPQLIDLFKPNLILNTETKYKEDVYTFLKYAKKQGVKTALYFNDMRCPVTQAVWCDKELQGDLREYLDYIFLCNETHRECWESTSKVKTFYMPQGTIQHPKPKNGTKYHILFIGMTGDGPFHKNRNMIMRDLQSKGIDVTVKNSPIRDQRAQIQQESYGDYHSSNYSLAISMEVTKYTSDRLYTIVGAGGCALAYKSLQLDDIFKDKEHLLWFRTSDEVAHILKFTTDEERAKIKENAFRYAQKHHTYKMRLLNILTNIYTEDKSFHGDINNLWKIGKL